MFFAKQRVSVLVLAAWSAQVLAPGGPEARAEDFFSSQQPASTIGADGVNPQVTGLNQTGGFFNTESIKNQGELFKNCEGGLQASVMNGMQDLAKAAQDVADGNFTGGAANNKLGYGVDAICPGSADAPSTELDCKLIAPAGVVDRAMIQAKLTAIDAALANVACNKGKLQSAKAELSCLSSQANLLAAQINSIQSLYSQNIERMKADVLKIDGVIADRDAQQKDVLDRLGGQEKDGGNGAKGLLGLQKELQIAVTDAQAGLPKQIQGFKDRNRVLKVKRQQLEEAVANRKMGLAAECFKNRSESNYRCAAEGTEGDRPVGALAYALCRYEQDQRVGARGHVEQNKAVTGQAKSSAAGLESLLNRILADTPQKIVASKDGAPIESGPPATIMTAADVESKYGAELDNYKIKGYDLHKFVIERFTYCYSSSSSVVDKERTIQSSGLSQQQKLVDSEEENLKTDQHTALNTNSLLWSKAMTALTGENTPLYPGKCDNADATLQTACLDDLKRNLEGLLQGNTKDSAIAMIVKGQSPTTNIAFTCNGLNGCISKLQNIDRNLKVEKTRLTTFKKSYVTQAQSSVEAFTKQMSSMMSAQGSALQQRIQKIKGAMAAMGAGKFDIPSVEPEQLEFDENGLPKKPKNVLNLIGSQMNPPMMKISGEGLSGALGAISEAVNDWSAKAKPLAEARSTMMAKVNACSRENFSRLSGSASRTAEEIAAANCGYSEQFCQNQDSLSRVMDTVNQVGDGLDDYDRQTIESSINTGIAACGSGWYVKGDKAGNLKRKTEEKGGGNIGTVSPACGAIATRLNRDLLRIGRSQGVGSGDATGAR